MAPLQAHVEACETCRAELDAQQRLVERLERLPHLAPAPLFANRVMKQVRVFEPGHVTILAAAQRFLPRSRPGRVLVGITAGAMALSLTLIAMWIVPRLNGVIFLGTAALERVRWVILDVVNDFAGSVVGGTAVASGSVSGQVGVLLGFLAAIFLAAAGLRLVAASSRRRRV